jgi:excisionase family DNA binding protein
MPVKSWTLEETVVAKQEKSGAVVDAAPQRRGQALASVREAEQYLNLSRATVYGLMDKGDLPYVKIGKCRRIPWAAIEDLVRTNTVGAG